MLDSDSGGVVFRTENGTSNLVKELRQPGVIAQPASQLNQALIGHSIHLKVVKQALHVGKLTIPLLLPYEGVTAIPELFRIDSKLRKKDILLHVTWTQRLVVIIDQGNRALRNRHRENRCFKVAAQTTLNKENLPPPHREWKPFQNPTRGWVPAPSPPRPVTHSLRSPPDTAQSAQLSLNIE